MTLTRTFENLKELRGRIEDECLTAMDTERLATTDLAAMEDEELAGEIECRAISYDHWHQTYRDEFIPFAHGARLFGEVALKDEGPAATFTVRASQLVGQPGGPGIAAAPARVVLGPADSRDFQPAEVLVCDAVGPNMTFVVPMAEEVVERRGGMLIHGAIIAPECRLPCVSGVPRVTELIHTGDRIAVDGSLGIVTVP